MLSNKIPKCKICGGPHYKTFCFNAPRKLFESSRTALKPKTITWTRKPQKPLKRTQIASKSTNERKSLISKLDRIFSTYIRRKDSIGGRARCVTCGTVAHWKNMQNGHFISRRYMNLRWDEQNCHVQCKNCNENLHGNLAKYEQYIIQKYGIKVVFHLREQINTVNKIQVYELSEKIAYYEQKVKELD